MQKILVLAGGCLLLSLGACRKEKMPDAVGPSGDSTAACIAYGPFHMDISEPHPYFNLVFRSVTTPAELTELVQEAAANDYKLVVNLAGQRNHFQDSAGHFDLDAFRSRLDAFKDFDFAPWREVVLCHLLFDEPHDPGNWGGEVVRHEDIEAAAAWSHALFPDLPVGVGAPAAWLVAQGTWQWLDYAKPQYSAKQGDVAAFVQANHDAAMEAGLRLLYSVNVLSGYTGQSPFPPDALQTVSETLLSDTLADGLLYWKYDSDYFADPEVDQAFRAVKEQLCGE